jgi:hypothetical protein
MESVLNPASYKNYTICISHMLNIPLYDDITVFFVQFNGEADPICLLAGNQRTS